MAHCTWTYVDDRGRRHRVGLFHGNRNGHVMIYINMKVTMVDFNIRDSKTYSFFIEEELCEIGLERKGDKMFYTFKINDKVDTPRNREKKKIHSKHLKQTLLFFGGMIVVAVLISIGLQWIKARQAAAEYGTNPDMVWATAIVSGIMDPGSDSMRISYRFTDEAGQNQFEALRSAIPNAPLLPLAEGDEFRIRYNQKHPYRHQLYLSMPSETTAARYLQLATEKQISRHPDTDQGWIACQVATVLEEKGVRALAVIYYQQMPPTDNAEFNSVTYRQLMGDPGLQQAIEESCGR